MTSAVCKVKHSYASVQESDFLSEHIIAFCKELPTNAKVLVLLETGETIPDLLIDIWNALTPRAVGYHPVMFSADLNAEYVQHFASNRARIIVTCWTMNSHDIPVEIFEAGLSHIIFAPFPTSTSSFHYIVDSANGNSEGTVVVRSWFLEGDRLSARILLHCLESTGDCITPRLRAYVESHAHGMGRRQPEVRSTCSIVRRWGSSLH